MSQFLFSSGKAEGLLFERRLRAISSPWQNLSHHELRVHCHGKIVPLKKRSGRIGIAGMPVPPEQFFLKSVIRTWKIDPEINTYRETYQADR